MQSGPPLVRLLVVASLVVAGACEDERAEPRPRARVSPTVPIDDAGASSLWPVRVEPLGAAASTTSRPGDDVHACLARHRAALTTGVAEALTDLGYDRFLEDVCAAERAADTREAEPCSTIASSAMREQCVARVAVLRGAPDACPTTSSGRDPLCLAFTTGEIAFCETVPTHDRVRCRAALGDDVALCRSAPDTAHCEATVARYATALRGRRRGHTITTRATLTARSLDDDGVLELTTPMPARGVQLVPSGCAHALHLDAATDRFGPRSALLELRLSIPKDATFPLRIPVSALTLRARIGGHTFDTLLGSTGTVTVTRFAARRLAPLALDIDVTVRDGDVRHRLTGAIETFVRDLDEPRCDTR